MSIARILQARNGWQSIVKGDAVSDLRTWRKYTDTSTPIVRGIRMHGRSAPSQMHWKDFMKKKKLKKENEILKKKLTAERILWHSHMEKHRKSSEDTLAIAIEMSGEYRRLIAYLLDGRELTICEDVIRDCKLPTIERLSPDKLHIYIPKD